MNTQESKENQLVKLANKGLLDTADLCGLFQVKPDCIKDWRRKNIISFTQISKRYYYLWSEIAPLIGKL